MKYKVDNSFGVKQFLPTESAKEMAFSLIKKFNPYTASITQKLTLENARGAALLAVGMILDNWDSWTPFVDQDDKNDTNFDTHRIWMFWVEVEAELKNI